MFSRYSANDPEGYVQKSEVLPFHHGIFPPKHEGSYAVKVLVDTNENLLVTNSDNYVYSYTHRYRMLLHL